MKKLTVGNTLKANGLIAKLITFIFLLLVTATTAWGEDQVVTIYFAGTGATEQWWDSNQSGFWTPELLATLYHEQNVPPTHHKKFINGIGTGCNIPLVDLIQQGVPELELLGCRGWNACLTEAEDFLNGILQSNSGEVILNLLGWSRGGVLTMRFANKVYTNGRIKRINILALDPAGHRDLFMNSSVPAEEFCLNEKVNHYIGIYASDERSYMFGTAIPDYTPETNAWIFRVPGSHETVMGNIQTDGHSIVWTPGCGFLWLEECFDDNLSKVSWVAKVIAVELLGSSQWGNVGVNWNWHDGLNNEAKRNLFIGKVDSMWNYDYSPMRKTSFIPFSFEGYGYLAGNLGCWWCDWADWLAFELYNTPRCSSLFTCPNVHINVPLEWYVPPINGQWAWTKLEELGNSPPVANAGADQNVYADATCLASVVLNGNGSSDPDNDPLQYTWTGTFGSLSGINPTLSLGPGLYNITLTVSDGKETNTDTVNITVTDNMPPNIALPANIIIPTDPGYCSAVVFYTVTAADNCPSWTVISNPSSGSVFSKGITTVTSSATDASGNLANGSFMVTVEDRENPIISNISVLPSVLWPPDHKLVDVTVNYMVNDNCDQYTCTLSVTSNEAINGTGDGDIAPAWEIVGPNKVRLRAERVGSGTGRIYTITISCTDTSGNSSTKTVAVTVPHDKGKK